MNTRYNPNGASAVPITLNAPRPNERLRELSFSSPTLPAYVVDEPGILELEGPSVVVNPSCVSIPLHPAGLLDGLKPHGARRFQAVGLNITETAVAVSLDRLQQPRAEALRPGWLALSDLPGMAGQEETKGVQLFRSPRDRVATISARPDQLSPALPPERPLLWGVFMNLWFAPAGTECLIHNNHPFLEYHVQISGQGTMQKFRNSDPSTLYEEQLLTPGMNHDVYSVRPAGDGTYHYPWHQYFANTDCIWLAVEMIPEGPAPRPVSEEFESSCCVFHAHS
ncbi:MAG: hypothetical protein ABJO67_06295 [Pseudoruegeria sp.]